MAGITPRGSKFVLIGIGTAFVGCDGGSPMGGAGAQAKRVEKFARGERKQA